MIYFKALKDMPGLKKGDIVVADDYGDDYEPLTKVSWNDLYYPYQLVEDQPEWFERVEQVFVKSKNVAQIEQIDEMADDNTDIAQPFEIPAETIRWPGIIPMTPGDVFQVAPRKGLWA